MARGRKRLGVAVAERGPIRVREDIEIPELVKSRIKIPKFKDDLKKLAEDSKHLLGYTLLSDVVVPDRVLGKALKRLHIRHYKPELVEEYKAEKLKEQRREHRGKWIDWQLIALDGYNKPVPEYVLMKCLEIKNEVPDANFDVDQLSVQDYIPDPFMVVSRKKERYYFEVWEEPKFEAKVLNGLALEQDDDSSDDEDEG